MPSKLPEISNHPKRWARALITRVASLDGSVKAADQARDRRDWALAAERYRRVLRRYPFLSHLRVQLAHMLKEMERFEEAEAYFQEFRSIKPTDADVYLQLGHLRRRQGLVEEARPWFEDARRLASPSSATEQEATAAIEGHAEALIDVKVRKVLALTDAGAFAAARTAIFEIAERDARVTIFGILGNISKELGLFDDALMYYMKYELLAETPFEKFDSTFHRGRFEKFRGHNMNALKYFKQSKLYYMSLKDKPFSERDIDNEIIDTLGQITPIFTVVT